MTATGTHCPHCGQQLRECPVCRTGVLPQHHNPNTVIDRHHDKAGHECKGAGLDYRHTIAPYPKGAA